jgi:hypothetical protein
VTDDRIRQARLLSEALRHLGIEAHATGRFDLAQRLEESTRLRRDTGNLAGARLSEGARPFFYPERRAG